MLKLIIKKFTALFVLTLLLLSAPALVGTNNAQASNSDFIEVASNDWTQVATTTITATADENAFVSALCNIFNIATGSGGKAFAAFAIISLGIGFFTGKVSWGLMLGVAAGIAAMFGAPTIVAAISGGSAETCANTLTEVK